MAWSLFSEIAIGALLQVPAFWTLEEWLMER